MPSFSSVLVYDGECPYCSVAARALHELDDVGAVSWYDDAAQAFLDAQFGATPFAMVLVDADTERVFAGRVAAGEVAKRAGMPDVVGALVRQNYETIARAVGIASGRGRDPEDYHGTYRLTDDARAGFDALVETAVDRDTAAVKTSV